MSLFSRYRRGPGPDHDVAVRINAATPKGVARLELGAHRIEFVSPGAATTRIDAADLLSCEVTGGHHASVLKVVAASATLVVPGLTADDAERARDAIDALIWDNHPR